MENRAKSAILDLELSRRLHEALTCGKEELFEALRDPSMDVIRAALRNPALDENHLHALLGRRDLTEELLKAISQLQLVGESHNLKVVMVNNPRTPASLVMTLLPQLYLFELVAVCFLPGVTPDQRLAAERAIMQRLPMTPLGNKITLARRATATVLDALLKERVVKLVEPCLENPRLKEASVYRLVSSPGTPAEAIAAVARHPHWGARPNLRNAMLGNPGTPVPLLATLLPTAPILELKKLASGRFGAERRRLAEQELRRRAR